MSEIAFLFFMLLAISGIALHITEHKPDNLRMSKAHVLIF